MCHSHGGLKLPFGTHRQKRHFLSFSINSSKEYAIHFFVIHCALSPQKLEGYEFWMRYWHKFHDEKFNRGLSISLRIQIDFFQLLYSDFYVGILCDTELPVRHSNSLTPTPKECKKKIKRGVTVKILCRVLEFAV